MLGNQKIKSPLLSSSIRQTINTDVFVIGEGLIGALTTYFFHQQNIPCVLLELPTSVEEAHVDLDIELMELSNNIDQALINDLFHSLLDSIYKLDAIMAVVEKERCQYERNPQLHYLRDEEGGMCGYALESGLLVYKSGVKFNSIELKNQLNEQLKLKGVPILDDPIDSIELDQGVTVYTPTKAIHAQKLIITSDKIYDLFSPTTFDATPYLKENCQDIVKYQDPIRYFMTDSTDQTYFLNLVEEDGGETKPLIGEDPLYPNVYFNVGNFHLLNGIIGSHFLRQLYLQSEISTLETIKFSYL